LICQIIGTPSEESWNGVSFYPNYHFFIEKNVLNNNNTNNNNNNTMNLHPPPPLLSLPSSSLLTTATTFTTTIIATTLKNMYQNRINEATINLLERIFVPDPQRRISARIALTNKYFLTQPLPVVDFSEIEPIDSIIGF
jgi:serine/threonine protein kinase